MLITVSFNDSGTIYANIQNGGINSKGNRKFPSPFDLAKQ
jgi:hypothetical protein